MWYHFGGQNEGDGILWSILGSPSFRRLSGGWAFEGLKDVPWLFDRSVFICVHGRKIRVGAN